MNPWTVWRIRRIRTRRWALTCGYPVTGRSKNGKPTGEPCDIPYWCDSSGRFDHGQQYGHRPIPKDGKS